MRGGATRLRLTDLHGGELSDPGGAKPSGGEGRQLTGEMSDDGPGGVDRGRRRGGRSSDSGNGPDVVPVQAKRGVRRSSRNRMMRWRRAHRRSTMVEAGGGELRHAGRELGQAVGASRRNARSGGGEARGFKSRRSW
jgi:hypothetical protein